MPPKGKKRIKRRSKRLSKISPNKRNGEQNGGIPSAQSCNHSSDSETDSVVGETASSSSSPDLVTGPSKKIRLDSHRSNHNEASVSVPADQEEQIVTDIIKLDTPVSRPSQSLDSTISPSTSHQSPNTELLVSNINLASNVTDSAANSSSSSQNISCNGNHNTEQSRPPTQSNSRTISLNSQTNVNTSGTISLRSRRRRPESQSRAIITAYRSIPSSLPVKGESYCDCPKTSRDLTCSCGEEDTVFEWRWDNVGKSAACDLSDENRTAIFHVSYSSGTAAVKGSQPMNDRQYFWEVKMTSPVYGTDMMVGIGTGSVNLDSFRHTFTSLLGRDGDSWGLSYYGRFQQKGQFRPVAGAKFGQGSIIGLHVDMWHGTLSYYKNRKPLGVLCSGLHGKTVYPMVSSTAARTTMKIIKACSFQTSLQFLCCQALRKMVPEDMDVTDVVGLPPGLKAFLANNLSWLLRPNEIQSDFRMQRKRHHDDVEGYGSSSEEDGDDGGPPKRFRFGTRGDISEASEVEDTPVDLAMPQT